MLRRMMFLLCFVLQVFVGTDSFGQSLFSSSKPSENKEVENVESPRFFFRRFLEVLSNNDVDGAFPYVELPSRMQLEQRRETIRELFAVLNKRGNIDLALISNSPSGVSNDLADSNLEDIGSIAVPGQNVRVILKLVSDRNRKMWKFSEEFMEKIPEVAQTLEKTDFENRLPPELSAMSFLGIKLWQWIGLGLAVGLSFLASMALAYLLFLGMKMVVRHLDVAVPKEIYTSFLTPLRLFIGLFVLVLALPYLDTDLEFRQKLGYIEAIVLTISFCIFALRITAASVELIRLAYEKQGKPNANAMLGPFQKGMSVLIVVLGGISLLKNLGFDVTAIIAGLGIGGVAIALAGQKTIENLFGGISIIMDQPVRVGDFGKFGTVSGTVEDIGLRSTKVRTLDRTLVSIPNAEFSHMILENFEKRDKFRWNAVLNIRMDASSDQLRLLLVKIKELMLAHPMVYKDPARVRFMNFGASSFDIHVFAYIKANDQNEYAGILEDLNLRVLDIIRGVGTDLAYPSSTIFFEKGTNRDLQKIYEVEKEIASIKESEGFPLPHYPSDWVDEKIDTLPFPEKS